MSRAVVYEPQGWWFHSWFPPHYWLHIEVSLEKTLIPCYLQYTCVWGYKYELKRLTSIVGLRVPFPHSASTFRWKEQDNDHKPTKDFWSIKWLSSAAWALIMSLRWSKTLNMVLLIQLCKSSVDITGVNVHVDDTEICLSTKCLSFIYIIYVIYIYSRPFVHTALCTATSANEDSSLFQCNSVICYHWITTKARHINTHMYSTHALKKEERITLTVSLSLSVCELHCQGY